MSSEFRVSGSPSPLGTRNAKLETSGEGQGERALDPLSDIPPDEGCDLAHSCLHCPFPRCRYDDRGLVRRLRHVTRRQEQARRLAALLAAGELAMEEAAGRLGVSRRTAFRLREGGR